MGHYCERFGVSHMRRTDRRCVFISLTSAASSRPRAVCHSLTPIMAPAIGSRTGGLRVRRRLGTSCQRRTPWHSSRTTTAHGSTSRSYREVDHIIPAVSLELTDQDIAAIERGAR